MFAPTSRYASLPTARLERADGKSIVYVRRRMVPPGHRFVLLQEHKVEKEERLDHIAGRYLGDPEQFWRLCDANDAIDPHELTTAGRRIRITLPEGIPGPSHA